MMGGSRGEAAGGAVTECMRLILPGCGPGEEAASCWGVICGGGECEIIHKRRMGVYGEKGHT